MFLDIFFPTTRYLIENEHVLTQSSGCFLTALVHQIRFRLGLCPGQLGGGSFNTHRPPLVGWGGDNLALFFAPRPLRHLDLDDANVLKLSLRFFSICLY